MIIYTYNTALIDHGYIGNVKQDFILLHVYTHSSRIRNNNFSIPKLDELNSMAQQLVKSLGMSDGFSVRQCKVSTSKFPLQLLYASQAEFAINSSLPIFLAIVCQLR